MAKVLIQSGNRKPKMHLFKKGKLKQIRFVFFKTFQ